MSPLKVLLADDNETVLQSVQRILETEFEIVGVVKDGQSLVGAAQKLKPDVMIVDVFMPGMSGIEAARQLKKRHVKGRIIFLTVLQDQSLADEARTMGRDGLRAEIVGRSRPGPGDSRGSGWTLLSILRYEPLRERPPLGNRFQLSMSKEMTAGHLRLGLTPHICVSLTNHVNQPVRLRK